jgi:hypothetical protein
MSEENPNPATSDEADSRAKERAAFIAISDTLEPLSPEARLRLLRLLITHFDLSFGDSAPRNAPVAQPNSSQPYGGGASFTEDRTLSPKQFMLEKKPLTDIERITCLAYYLAHYRESPHFKTLDLSKLNTEAAQTKLSNPSKTSDNAVARGLVMQVGGGKRQISALGELYVQALPDREAAKAAIAHQRRRRKQAKGRSSEIDQSENE